MSIPNDGFAIVITRLREEHRGNGSARRYRTVGEYQCYWNGVALTGPNLSGATVEPRGPGDNSQTGVNNSRRIEAGSYELGTHGWNGSKYRTFHYKKNAKPRPGVYVHDTDKRSAILIHSGSGFKATIGCINLTGSIVGPLDNIGPNTSYKHMHAFIGEMRTRVAGFPTDSGERIPKAWLIIQGEP
mmetsp:Transcript_26981/g.48904  ORF Transcript_26981/g.48904 Transcript_26981/m.48904 type:complete len:186 (+) Transcript_26981:2879-3436(+)